MQLSSTKKYVERRNTMDKHTFPSIEKLAAYFDGNLPREEMLQISQLAENNESFRQVVEDISLMEDAEATFSEQNIQPPDDIVGEGFKLPDIDNLENFSPLDDSFWGTESLFIQEGFNAEELNQDFEPLNNINNMATNYRTYGESGENIYDPIYIKQPDDHSCGLRSQQIVLRDFGIDIPFDELEQIAKDAGVYSDQGTRTYDVGKVMEMAGVGMHQVTGGTIYDLTNELAQGHRVIVSVDANELWHNHSLTGKLTNWFQDVFGHQGGNHALVVAGVEVNPSNPNDVKVVLTDPGAGHLRIEYPLTQFMDAWKDSNCFMAATDNAAPFQYDAATGMEVPSGFSSDFLFNPFIEEHGYQLSPDTINYPLSYQPTFTGHIDMIGNLSYDDYLSQHDAGILDMNQITGGIVDPFDMGSVTQYEPYPYDGVSAETKPDPIDQDPIQEPYFDPFTLGGDTETAGSVGESLFEKGEGIGSEGNWVQGDGAESAGSAGASLLGDGAEEAGSVGSSMLGDSVECAGSVASSLLGDGAEGSGSVGSSLLGDDSESAGGVGNLRSEHVLDDFLLCHQVGDIGNLSAFDHPDDLTHHMDPAEYTGRVGNESTESLPEQHFHEDDTFFGEE